MKKDRITSVILIALVLSSVMLTVKIWFSEELWPDGYNFFVNPKNIVSLLPFFGDNDDESDAVAPLHETVFMPDKIIVGRMGAQRSIYSGESDAFLYVNDYTKKLLSKLLSDGKEKYEISREEYYSTVRGPSLLVEYPVSIPSKVIGHMCEVNDSEVFSDINFIRDYVITPEGTHKGGFLYIRDSKAHSYFKYFIDCNREELLKIIDDYAGVSGYMSAYELGFYKKNENKDSGQLVVFDPFVFINTSNQTSDTECIRGINPFSEIEPSEIEPERINDIIRAFGYNPNAVRRYTDSDGTLVLVEAYSTIKLYKSGLMEYTTTTPQKGIDMQIHADVSESPQNIPDAVDNISEIMWGVWNALDAGDMPDVRLGGDVTDNYSDYKISFDYRYKGVPVIFDSSVTAHAVEAEVRDNLLISLKAVIRTYEPSGEYAGNVSPLRALDRFYEELNVSSEAKDFFLGYTDFGTSGKIYTRWNILQEDGVIYSVRR